MNDDNNNNPSNNNNSLLYNGGFVGILNLPVGSTITYDSNQPLMLQRDDFVGFTTTPSTPFADGNDNDANDNSDVNEKNDDNNFHLVTVRAAVGKKGGGTGGEQLGVAVGFILPFQLQQQQQQTQSSDSGCLLLLRQYDPTTEEVSSVPVDPITTHNLMNDLRNRQIQPHRIMDYNNQQLMASGKAQLDNKWKNLTNYISSTLLQKRGVNAGDKLVAGSYDDDDIDINRNKNDDKRTPNNKIEDGKSLTYPCIPVMNNKSANSHRQHCQHEGTKRWLATTKSPSQRTELFMAPNPASLVLRQILNEYYDSNWRELLGDVQLSYTVFLQLHCYASLSHWRDMVAMMCCVERDGILQHVDLFCKFLDTLCCQLTTMEGEDFFVADADMSEGNFLIPSLQQLTTTLSQIVYTTTTTASGGGGGGDGGHSNNSLSRLDDALFKLNRILSEKFPSSHFGGPEIIEETTTSGANNDGHIVASDNNQQNNGMMMVQDDESDMDDMDDEDGPVVVPMEEFELSIARSEAAVAADLERRSRMHQCPDSAVNYPLELRKQYPVLFAAIMPNEDVLMTCARALDDKSDVSLVREAADYLEHVEAKK